MRMECDYPEHEVAAGKAVSKYRLLLTEAREILRRVLDHQESHDDCDALSEAEALLDRLDKEA